MNHSQSAVPGGRPGVRRRPLSAAVGAMLATALASCCWCLQAQAQLAVTPQGLLLIDAIRGALQQNPNTLLQQQQVVNNRGLVLQAKSPFDTNVVSSVTRSRVANALRADQLSTLQSSGVNYIVQDKNDTTTSLIGVQKMFAFGPTVGINYNVMSTNDNLNNLQNIPSQTTGQLSFTLALPLLKNAGRETVGAQLDSANAQLAASEYDLLQSNAQTVLNTTFAYWDYLAKQQNLEIATTAEQSSMALVDQLNRLIKGDQLPAADIELAIASRAEKTASRIAAEQALLDARRVLARQIGLPAMQMLNLPLPGDAYPRYDEAVRKLQLDRDALVKSALDQRADLAANRQRELAAKYLLVAARNNLKPQLDLNFSAGYAGLAENVPTTAFERAYYENRYGPSFSASISFRWPVENSLARGTVLSQSAQMDAATIQIRDLEATIASNVSTQVPGLERSVSQLAQGIEAVRRYTTAVNNEITKRRVGTSTVLDVINVEDRLVFARQNEVLLRQAYANAIAQLRFETGSLVHKKGDVYDVRASDLLEPVFGTAH